MNGTSHCLRFNKKLQKLIDQAFLSRISFLKDYENIFYENFLLKILQKFYATKFWSHTV